MPGFCIQILSRNPYPVIDSGSQAISCKVHFIFGVEAIAVKRFPPCLRWVMSALGQNIHVQEEMAGIGVAMPIQEGNRIWLNYELTGITVKAIAKAVEGMDNESYNKGQGLEPVINRLTRAAVGEPSNVMSVAKVTGIEESEVNYKLD
jgi:hypothetical protein